MLKVRYVSTRNVSVSRFAVLSVNPAGRAIVLFLFLYSALIIYTAKATPSDLVDQMRNGLDIYLDCSEDEVSLKTITKSFPFSDAHLMVGSPKRICVSKVFPPIRHERIIFLEDVTSMHKERLSLMDADGICKKTYLIKLEKSGAEQLSNLTSVGDNRRLVLVLHGEAISAPMFFEQIRGGEFYVDVTTLGDCGDE